MVLQVFKNLYNTVYLRMRQKELNSIPTASLFNFVWPFVLLCNYWGGGQVTLSASPFVYNPQMIHILVFIQMMIN